jgi:hypothetical protein
MAMRDKLALQGSQILEAEKRLDCFFFQLLSFPLTIVNKVKK